MQTAHTVPWKQLWGRIKLLCALPAHDLRTVCSHFEFLGCWRIWATFCAQVWCDDVKHNEHKSAGGAAATSLASGPLPVTLLLLLLLLLLVPLNLESALVSCRSQAIISESSQHQVHVSIDNDSESCFFLEWHPVSNMRMSRAMLLGTIGALWLFSLCGVMPIAG